MQLDPDSATAAANLHVASQRRTARPRLDVLAVIAGGGVLGAEARYGVSVMVPHAPTAFPWSTLLINAAGCVLIGVLMVVITEVTTPHRLAGCSAASPPSPRTPSTPSSCLWGSAQERPWHTWAARWSPRSPACRSA